MRERVVRFGAGNGLVGILTEPEPIRSHPDRPAIIFLNSGILHRVGSCRMHVRLAWALAEAGYPSLRFDLSGIGDSDTRKDALAFEQSAPLEIREAMDRVALIAAWSDLFRTDVPKGLSQPFLRRYLAFEVQASCGRSSSRGRWPIKPCH